MDESPRKDRLHPDLQVDYGCTLVGSLLIFGLPGLFLIGVPGLVLLDPPKTDEYIPGAATAAFFGGVLLLMCLLLGRSASWYRRCSRVFRDTSATPMRVHVIRNERGGLFLELHDLSDTGLQEPRVRIQAQVPTWDLSDLDGQVMKVRLDEDPKGPVVVETPRGVLWPAPLSRRMNRVEGRLI